MPIDPPEVELPEGNEIRAESLKNRVCLFLPQLIGEEPGKFDKPWRYIECDVAVLDRAGIEQVGRGVRIAWAHPYWSLREALEQRPGSVVAGKPKQAADPDSKAVQLVALTGEAKRVAVAHEAEFLERVKPEPAAPPSQQQSQPAAPAQPETQDDFYDEEPF